MSRLTVARRAQILGMIVEGMSIRSITRLTGASKNTVVKLLRDAGCACAAYQDRTLRNLPCKRLQLDEIRSFVYAKQKNVPTAKVATEQAGDVWTWTALCADTKLVPSWLVGSRDAEHANAFVADLASRLASRAQLTSDGRKTYLEAVEGAFGAAVDYAMLVKVYGQSSEAETRDSPAEHIGCHGQKIAGNPDPGHVSTSFAERNNLNIRMGNRRFTRLTNAFSKKMENHMHALAIYFMHYNFVRIHQTTRLTPAMAAGVSQTPWSLEDIVRVVDQWATGSHK